MYARIALVLHLALAVAIAQTDDAGRALQFDGTTGDYVSVNPFSNFPSNAVTIEFWMQTSDTTKAGTPLSYATTAEDNMLFIHDYRDFRFRLDGTAIPASGGTGISANNGSWQHIALMWRNNGLFVLYRNGVQVYSAAGIKPGFLIPSGGAMVIGQEQDSRGGGFQAAEAFLGTIDELRVWSVQRTEPQIKANMHRSLGGNETGLILYYRMDEAGGTSMTDSSGDGHTGTLVGATRVLSFAPVGLPPGVNTLAATAVSASSATLNGTVDANNFASVGFFEYGTNFSQLTLETTRQSINATVGEVPIARTASGLAPSTLYYFRAVGSNLLGEVLGSITSFTTLGPPSVKARAATGVTTDRATLWATINMFNSPTSLYFDYGTTTNYGLRSETFHYGNFGFGDVGLGLAVSNLIAETTYHYRGVASNIFGVTYGPDTTFVTQIFGEAVNFSAIGFSDATWGDYDNDGDLDVLLSGRFSGTQPVVGLYKNDGNGSFSLANSGFPAFGLGVARWADFDNDGWLDLFAMGYTNTSSTAKGFAAIRRNNRNGTFSDINAGLVGMAEGAAAWGDYDNDGDLDLVMTGTTNGQYVGAVSQVLRNNGDGTFTNGFSVPGISRSAVAWGDYDNDGDLDLALCGAGSDGSPFSWVMRNDGNNGFNYVFPFSVGVRDGSLAWGDYDSDGDLDALLTGTTTASGAALNGVTQIWRNTGNGNFTLIGSSLPGISGGNAAWGDYDNDGDLDIALTGIGTNSVSLTQLYSNNGDHTFTRLDTSLPAGQRGFLAWVDYDNDADLDLALLGPHPVTSFAHVRRNDSFPPNTVPEPPTALGSSVTTSNVVLHWQAATDAQTPSNALTYNLRVTPAVLEAHADPATGNRRVVEMGNVQQGTNATLILSNYPSGTYYWTVQAIDSAFAGGPFAPTNIIELAGRPSITPLPPINLTPNSATLQALVNPGGRNTSASLDFGPTPAYGTQLGLTNIGNGYADVLIAGDIEALSPDTVYYYRATAFNVFGPATGANVSFRTPFFDLYPRAIAVALAPGAATNVFLALSNRIATAVNITNRFLAPPPTWAAVMNPTLTLAANGNANVNLLIDATGLMPDIYQSTLEIVSGSTHATVQVPVELTVLAADPAQIHSVVLQPNGSMLLDFAGTSGYAQTVFASTNLEDWVAIGPATQISPGRFQFTDPAATNFTQRFYKIRTP